MEGHENQVDLTRMRYLGVDEMHQRAVEVEPANPPPHPELEHDYRSPGQEPGVGTMHTQAKRSFQNHVLVSAPLARSTRVLDLSATLW